MAKIPLAAVLKLASFLKARNVAGRDNSDGSMEIDDPLDSGKITVRDAQIFGHLPIVEGSRPTEDYVSKLTQGATDDEIKGYKITREEYIAALCGVVDRDARLRPTPEQLQLPNLEALSYLKETDPELHFALELNTRFGKVDMDGQVVIFDLKTGTSYRKDDFLLLLSAEKVTVTVKKKTDHGTESRPKELKLAKNWLEHPAHLRFDGIGMYPEGRNRYGRPYRDDPHTARHYNLWHGYDFEPKPGDWHLMKEHIFNILCRKDQTKFEYLMNWMAFVLQKPWVKPGVAVGAIGGKRVGKGIVSNSLRDIIGKKHARMVAQKDHATGKFAGLGPLRFLQVEEALFSGDRRIVGPLKAMITEPTMTVEEKFRKPVEIDSYTAFWFNSNETRHAVSATGDDERYFVLDVSDEKKGDRAYFKAIIDELDDGGREAMAYDLMHRDIAMFDVRDVPLTEAFGDLVLANLESDEKSLLEIVKTGEIIIRKSDGDIVAHRQLNAREVTWIAADEVYRALDRSFAEYGDQHGRISAIGAALREYGLVTKKTSTDNRRGEQAKYCFKPLEEIRAFLSEKWKVPVEKLGNEPDQVAIHRTAAEELLLKVAELENEAGVAGDQIDDVDPTLRERIHRLSKIAEAARATECRDALKPKTSAN
jgi:hypothetical protein